MSEALRSAFEPPSGVPLSVLFRLYAFFIGLAVGSFANVCVHRIPLGLSVVRPRSRCPRCGRAIRALENVPLLSWLALRGRCAGCREPISARYPLVELANALLWLAIAFVFEPGLQAVVAMLLATALLVLALIDYDHQLLPDVITKPGIAVGLAASFLPGRPEPLGAAAAAAAGYFGCAALFYAWLWLRKEEALGQGDWKMIAMLGAFFGWDGMLLSVLMATLAGSIVGVSLIAFGGGSRATRLPLGTFLSGGGVITLLAGEPLLAWYRGLLGG